MKRGLGCGSIVAALVLLAGCGSGGGTTDTAPNDAMDEGGGQENCSPETDQGFCTRLGIGCGSVTEFDKCGASRPVGCGSCSLPRTRGGGGAPGPCGGAPGADRRLCTSLPAPPGGLETFAHRGPSST